MHIRLCLPFLILLLIFGCKEEETSPKPCGQADLTINGVSSKATKPVAVISETETQFNMRLYTVVNTKDTLQLSMGVYNWVFANPNPIKALINTFTNEVKFTHCKSSVENLGNCAAYFGNAVYKTKDLVYYILDQEPDQQNKLRILRIDKSKRKLSGDFNLRAVKIDAAGLGDTITISGSFTDVCYLINKIE